MRKPGLLIWILPAAVLVMVVITYSALIYYRLKPAEQGPRGGHVPAGQYTGSGGSGGTKQPFESFEELPENMKRRIEQLYLARARRLTPLDSVVGSFSLTEATVPEAVSLLSNEYYVLCGIEVVPWPAAKHESQPVASKRISLSLRRVTPRKILDKLVSEDPTFTWIDEQGVANVVVRAAYEQKDYPLNRRIPHFRAEDRPYSRVFAGPEPAIFGLPGISESLPVAMSGRWPVEFEPTVSLDAADATLRELINQVARQMRMSWMIASCGPNETMGEPLNHFSMRPNLPESPCGRGDLPDPNLPVPTIAFEQTLHDFGEVLVGKSARCEFKLTNAGSALLRIISIDATCGCTTAATDTTEYQPGREGVIRVEYAGQSFAGIVEERIIVTTNDPLNPRTRLTIHANIVPTLGVGYR